MSFTVTRQLQWPDAKKVVEIGFGSFDYANPDCLSAKYPGEMQEFLDPREAVETAIEIAKAWQADELGESILIDRGATGGMTMPFDGEPLTPEVFAELRAWAEKRWDALEKCDGCQDALPPKRDRWSANDWSGDLFCSRRCAERAMEYDEAAKER